MGHQFQVVVDRLDPLSGDLVDGSGTMVLDDEEIEVHSDVVVSMRRGVRHKAVGGLTIVGGRPQASNRVKRGGWNSEPRNARSANRNRNVPENRNNNLGFRLARAQRTWWIPRRTEPAAFPSRGPARRAKCIPGPPGACSPRERSGRPAFDREGSRRRLVGWWRVCAINGHKWGHSTLAWYDWGI